MKILFFIFIFFIQITGCSYQPPVWTKQGATQNDLAADRYECLKNSQKRVVDSSAGCDGVIVSCNSKYSSDVVTDKTIFEACMNAKGWNLTFINTEDNRPKQSLPQTSSGPPRSPNKFMFRSKSEPDDFINERLLCAGSNFEICMQNRGWRVVAKSDMDANAEECSRSSKSESGQRIESLFKKCMLSKGFDLNSKYMNELEKISDKARARCNNPEFNFYYSKTPCLTNGKMDFKYYADDSKLNEKDKSNFVKVAASINDELNERIALDRQYVTFKKRSNLMEKILLPKLNDNLRDLLIRKINWGQFNRRRDEIFSEYLTELKNNSTD